jgi:hypothetical protein
MTIFESGIRLDFNRGFFDSVETDILCAAFERAWAFVESDPSLGSVDNKKSSCLPTRRGRTGGGVLIQRRRGWFKRVVITPDDPDGFINQVKALQTTTQ